MLQLLISLLAPKPVPVQVEVPKCTGKDHVFVRGQTRCACNAHDWVSYCRRWDRR